jgi:phosphoenolpyruvate carboxylase
MLALAARSPDRNPHRADEPYRRALIGIYARLAATLHALTGTEALRHAVAPQTRTRRRRVPGRPAHHRGSRCAPTTRRRWSGTAAGAADARVQVFGFHLATLDLRQSSDQHEAVVAELLRVARLARLRRAAGREGAPCLLQLLNDARPLRVRGATTRRWRRASWPSSRPRARAARATARGAAPLHHQPHRGGERPAGGAAAAEGMRAAAPARWTTARAPR